MKLGLPTIVDAAQVPSGDAAVLDEASSIANNVAPHDGNDAAMAINEATTNNAPKNAPSHAPNNAPNDSPKNASAPTNNVSISENIAAPAVNNVPAILAPLNDVLAPPNHEDAVPGVDVVMPPVPINAPTVKDAPTNVVVKMEQMESEDVVMVPNKKYNECVILVLDQTMTKMKMSLILPLFLSAR